jgi:serine acetyltransferase
MKMAKENFFKILKEDYKVFRLVYRGNPVLAFFYNPSFKIVLIFRLSQLCNRFILTKIFAYLLTMLNDFLHGVWLPSSVKIGKGFFLGHPRGLIVNSKTVIGDYCSIIQRVTIGGPKVIIGNYVEITSSVSIISNRNKDEYVKIGDNCIIAAGAVVLKSMPENSVIGGVPAKVLKEVAENENWVTKRTFENFNSNKKN